MRKNYLEPSIEITAFDSENIVMASAVTGTESTQATYEDAVKNGKKTASVSYRSFEFTF